MRVPWPVPRLSRCCCCYSSGKNDVMKRILSLSDKTAAHYFKSAMRAFMCVCVCNAFFSLKRGRRIPYFFCPLGDRHHIMTNKNKNKNKNENNMNNSKEETEGRDTPLSLYSAIVGGEGQDFVATTLSTSAQVCDTLYTRAF